MIRFAAIYPAVGLLLKLLQLIKPSLAARRVAHLAFTQAKTEKRLERKTERKDIMTYASLPLPEGPSPFRDFHLT